VLTARAGHVRIQGESLDCELPRSALQLSERLGAAPRRLALQGGGHCEVRDHTAFAALISTAGFKPGWVEGAQRSWPVVLASLAALLLFAGGFYRWGIPWLADATARHASPRVAKLLADHTLDLLDSRYLKPSTLKPERQQQLQLALRALRDSDGRVVDNELLFRSGGDLGANALTLADGRIVLLDELVALADDDEQIVAALAHERGHAVNRHGLQLLVRSTMVGTLATWWFGDVSNLLVIGPTLLLNTEYSRTLETEADDHAIRLLTLNHIAPQRLAQMLRKLQSSHAKSGPDSPRWMHYLDTHPGINERIDRIEKQNPLPAPTA
jgi:Zn-dependent protease with chaperone function